jgi:YcaO-like protein with predicted kinase domain
MYFCEPPRDNKGHLLGTHRAVEPRQTLDRVLPLLRSFSITRVADITGLDRIGLPVAAAIRPNSKSLSVSLGKGITLTDAKISCIMEAIELFHAEEIELPLCLGSSKELKPTACLVDVERLPRTPNSRYHDDQRLFWIEANCLISGKEVWVPYECVHTNAILPEPIGSGCFCATSNGLASGNTLLEAISQGICEVVERDATTLWHLLSEWERRDTKVDLATIDDPLCRAILEMFECAELDLIVWETTSDAAIPAFVCTLFERIRDSSLSLYTSNGAGSHPDKVVALLRALTEVAQSRLTLIAGARDDLTRAMYRSSRESDQYHDWLITEVTFKGTRCFRDIVSYTHKTFNEDVNWELERLHSCGIDQLLVVNLTKSEIGVPVARVIAPGLEGSDEVTDYMQGRRARERANR